MGEELPPLPMGSILALALVQDTPDDEPSVMQWNAGADSWEPADVPPMVLQQITQALQMFGG